MLRETLFNRKSFQVFSGCRLKCLSNPLRWSQNNIYLRIYTYVHTYAILTYSYKHNELLYILYTTFGWTQVKILNYEPLHIIIKLDEIHKSILGKNTINNLLNFWLISRDKYTKLPDEYVRIWKLERVKLKLLGIQLMTIYEKNWFTSSNQTRTHAS